MESQNINDSAPYLDFDSEIQLISPPRPIPSPPLPPSSLPNYFHVAEDTPDRVKAPICDLLSVIVEDTPPEKIKSDSIMQMKKTRLKPKKLRYCESEEDKEDPTGMLQILLPKFFH